VVKGMFWSMTKKEILEWLDMKERDFSRKENINPYMSNDEWMKRYVYIELHEIFFGEFPIILTEWLERLMENVRRYRDATPRNWTPDLVRKINFASNNTSCTVTFWLDRILGGYITEFPIDCT
jgi:hypothetical protein